MKNFLLNNRQFRSLALVFSLFCTVSTAALAQAITSFSPNSGPVGMEVTITGTNFTNVTGVTFNGTPAASFTVPSNTTIKAFVAAGTTSGKINVTTTTGNTNSVADFTVYVKWVGGFNGNNWDDNRNWSNLQVPTSSTNVMIEPGGSPIVTNSAVCKDLTLLSASLTLNDANSNLSIYGDFSPSSSSFYHTAGNITFAGTGGNTQKIPALTYYDVTISGSGTKELQGNTAIHNLSFLNSNLTTKDLQNITLTLEGNISGETTSHSYIGKLVKTRSVSGVVTDNFGNIGIGFTNTNGGDWGAVTATRVTGQAISTPNGSKSINRYWTITPTQMPASPSVSLKLTWLDSELNGLAFTNGQAQAWRQELGNTEWIPVDNMQNIASNGSERSITVNTNTFSMWAITDQMNPLPVEMTSFTGKATVAGSVLNWATASEKNAASFEVERSVNGKTFETIGSVKANGNSNSTSKYVYTDRNVTNKVNYYRLRMVDLDGTFEYSSIVTITNNAKANDLAAVAYPNPFNESLNIKINTAVSKAEVVLNTVDGKEIYRQVINEASPVTNLSLTNLPKMKAGFYLLNLIVDGKATVLKVAQQ